jgi:hypothetical protein
MARLRKDGTPGKSRTSIDVDPRILAVFEAKCIDKSAWFDRQAKLYFGLSDLDDEIRKLQSMDAAIAIARQEDDKKELDRQRAELAAVMNAQSEERQAAAESDRAESHNRKLRDTWLVLIKKKQIFEDSIDRKFPENDIEGDYADYFPQLAKTISKLASLILAAIAVMMVRRGIAIFLTHGMSQKM